ncbi:DUF2919 domain-containing protein [Vibrio anguillarum]|uniref:DUF2919 domain-containing protein n=1 Tax=Vibrio anguillarum TaxID=55601 RepID=UPI00188AA3B1|nr:DUF2919 domain-containing protein [Vibrio anguillarum]MBF4335513.1 DUF2919 domain-containing protein [Vibrio anguillarum]
MMRYALERYDQNGFLKAPKLIWLGWLFLAKAWVVFVVAGASRDNGTTILTIVYPDHSMLYLGLIIGLPSIILMWLISLRAPERSWLNRIVSMGKPLTLLMVILQFMQTLYHIYLEHGVFNWANASTLLVLLWFGLYLLKSKSVRDCFSIPLIDKA